MLATGTELIPPVLGVLFVWTGGAKALSGSLARQATDSALHQLLGDVGRTTLALRALGWCELALGIGLLVAPGVQALAAATVLLGTGFLGYLTYAKVKAPGSSCGCAASRSAPVTWRAFARAGLVVGGGLLAAGASAPWWTTVSTHPVAATVFVLASGLLLLALSADLDRWWLLPSRAIWLRVVGHPLAAGRHTGNGTHEGEDVPVAASVELLEQSLAWRAAAPLVRSSLREHWDADGWRVLAFGGQYDGEDGARQVSVLFALATNATTDTTRRPVIRVSVVDDERQELIPDALDAGALSRPADPLMSRG